MFFNILVFAHVLRSQSPRPQTELFVKWTTFVYAIVMKLQGRKILVGLSGGVDSAVAAYLLKEQGFEVRAVFMKNFSERVEGTECPWREDRLEAYKAAAFLGIPVQTWDFQKEYRDRVLQYLFSEYRRGRTPNPDVFCNKEIKFKAFLERARRAGFSKIATGHYAGITRDRNGLYHLHKASDRNKDQSYFLAQLNQKQLAATVFPLARMRKPAVRALAKKLKLPNAARPDSQGICFVGPVSMRSFLATRIKPKKGDIVDTEGRVLGQHDGVYYYTIGQRRGINIGGGRPLYVIDKDIKRNRLIVGTARDLKLLKQEIRVTGWRWLSRKRPLPLHCSVKIRYRQSDQKAVVRHASGSAVRVRFAKPQRAVAPGQILAAYKGTELVASGVIA